MLFVEDQEVKVNGVLLPGVVKKIEVTSTARIDEQEIEGSAVKPKQATGYDDAKVIIDILLDDTDTQSRYQRLQAIQGIFRVPGQAVPQPLPIVCEDTAIHGISTVLFKQLRHARESKKNQLPVTLEFVEYNPQTIKTTKSQAKTAKKKTKTASPTGSGLTADYKGYLNTGRGSSPAKDTASTVAYMQRLDSFCF